MDIESLQSSALYEREKIRGELGLDEAQSSLIHVLVATMRDRLLALCWAEAKRNRLAPVAHLQCLCAKREEWDGMPPDSKLFEVFRLSSIDRPEAAANYLQTRTALETTVRESVDELLDNRQKNILAERNTREVLELFSDHDPLEAILKQPLGELSDLWELDEQNYYSDTFCILPWIHSFVNVNGDVRLCCVASREGIVGSVQRESLRDVWNSSKIREVRHQMMTGEKVEACGRCNRESERGVFSTRQNYNSFWLEADKDRELWRQRVRQSVSQEFEVARPPVYYDLRPGNLCTLKCRMCNSSYSSLIERDPVHGRWALGEQREESTRFSNGHHWYAADGLVLDEILENMQDTRQFYLAGGEPFVNPLVIEMVDRLIERGVAKRIRLFFSTNLTVVPEDLIRKLAEFEFVWLGISIDGVGQMFEYIRFPGVWHRIVENLEKIVRHRTFICNISATVQNYNVLSIGDLLRFSDSQRLPCNLNLLYDPPFLSVRVMPRKAKELAIRRLRECERELRLSSSITGQSAASTIEHVVSELEQDDGRAYEESILEFMKFTNDLDGSRQQSFSEVCPELYQFIVEDRGAWPTDCLFHESGSHECSEGGK